MFNNILYFIIVFALFSYSEPDTATAPGPYEAAAGILAGYAFFYLLVKSRFDRLGKAYAAGDFGSFTYRHSSCISRCMLLAVIGWTFFIYGLHAKALLVSLPFVAMSDFMQSFIAAALFFVFLIIVWRCAYPTYKVFINTAGTLRGYLASHIRFNSSLIAPWLIFSAIFDATRLLPQSAVELLNKNAFVECGFMAGIFIALGVFFPALLVRLWGCKPLAPGPVRDRLTDFCKNAGLTLADILEWNLFEGKLITAGVMGFVSRFRYLLISPALLDILDAQELEAVVAHEIGHVKRHHIFFYLLFILGYMFFAYVFFASIFYTILSNKFIFDLVISADGRPGPAFLFLSIGTLIGVLLVYFRLLFGLFSRNFERQADGYSCLYTGSGRGIIASLEKIAFAGSQSRTSPNWHHYSIQQRVDFMRRCEFDPQLVKRHDRKVRRLIAAYCGAFILVGILYAGLGNFIIDDSELSVLQKITQRRIEAEPDNPQLQFLLANICFEKKNFECAVSGYLAALRLSPENAEVLNNLAWLYATAQDETWRNPAEALRLSRKAVELDPKPHILDTLAESYYQNGDFRSALAAINLAIAQKPSDQSYFERQRKKFLQRLKEAEEDHTEDDFDTPGGAPGVSI